MDVLLILLIGYALLAGQAPWQDSGEYDMTQNAYVQQTQEKSPPVPSSFKNGKEVAVEQKNFQPNLFRSSSDPTTDRSFYMAK